MTPKALLERDAQGLAVLRVADYAAGIEDDGTLATSCESMNVLVCAFTTILARRWFDGDTDVAWHFLRLLSDELFTQVTVLDNNDEV